ncbi:hypothetical protein GCWU000246_01106 [Jonquetella anthropi E3_33 E1]|nr:hypothetical protein GCWU000246_01106 [Jonquetella anthropi E3_33 E1]
MRPGERPPLLKPKQDKISGDIMLERQLRLPGPAVKSHSTAGSHPTSAPSRQGATGKQPP